IRRPRMTRSCNYIWSLNDTRRPVASGVWSHFVARKAPDTGSFKIPFAASNLLSRFLFIHFLPKLLGRFAVDRLQSLDGTKNLGVTFGLVVAMEFFEGHVFQQRQVSHFCLGAD